MSASRCACPCDGGMRRISRAISVVRQLQLHSACFSFRGLQVPVCPHVPGYNVWFRPTTHSPACATKIDSRPLHLIRWAQCTVVHGQIVPDAARSSTNMPPQPHPLRVERTYVKMVKRRRSTNENAPPQPHLASRQYTVARSSGAQLLHHISAVQAVPLLVHFVRSDFGPGENF